MRPMFMCLGATLLLTACEMTENVTGPSANPTQSPGQSQSSTQTHRLTGTVTSAGRPVSGVEIAELQTVYGDDCFIPQELSETSSDADGSYSLPAVLDASTSRWPSWLRASKPGYFADFQRPWISDDMRIDFVLDPWVHISLGEVVRRTVNAGNAVCRGNSYGLPGFCHRFALTAPSDGTLEVTLTWPTSRPDVVLDVVRPTARPCALFSWPGGTRHSLTIPAAAGATYEIRVVDDGNASPLNYELRTALR